MTDLEKAIWELIEGDDARSEAAEALLQLAKKYPDDVAEAIGMYDD